MSAQVNTAAYQVGQVVGAVGARYKTSRTLPPDHFDMATILDAMLSADRFAKSDEDRKILRQVEGIGTSRTRQSIVDGLVNKGLLYTERRGKKHVLRANPIAIEMRSKLPPILTDVALTAKWELAFSMIERGEVDWRDVVDRTYLFVQSVVEQAKGQRGKFEAAEPASKQAGKQGVVRK